MEKCLEGIKVLEYSQFLAGPFTSMVLGDLGAKIVKIERINKGDPARNYPPFLDGESILFLSFNRNKKSLTLNIEKNEGKEILLRLIRKSDIFIENFRPGVMKRIGIEYETLNRINPRIIYVSCSGFGQNGPLSRRAAKDIIIQAMAGTMSITGMPEGPPTRVGYAIGDIAGAMYGVIAILAALYEREKSGKGQFIDISLLDCQLAFCQFAINNYLCTGNLPEREGNKHPFVTPFQILSAQDGFVTIVVGDDLKWREFCKKIGQENLIDEERFKTNALRTKNRNSLEEILNVIFLGKKREEWITMMDEIGVPCGPVNTIDKAVENEHVRARKMVKEFIHKKVGKHKLVNSPIKFLNPSVTVENSAPCLGEHTEEVLKEYLLLSSEQIESLRKRGIV